MRRFQNKEAHLDVRVRTIISFGEVGANTTVTQSVSLKSCDPKISFSVSDELNRNAEGVRPLTTFNRHRFLNTFLDNVVRQLFPGIYHMNPTCDVAAHRDQIHIAGASIKNDWTLCGPETTHAVVPPPTILPAPAPLVFRPTAAPTPVEPAPAAVAVAAPKVNQDNAEPADDYYAVAGIRYFI